MRLLLLATLSIAVSPLLTYGDTPDYTDIYPTLPGVSEEIQAQHTRMLNLKLNDDYESAIAVANTIIEEIEQNDGQLAVPLLNLALLQAGSGELNPALNTLSTLIERIENKSGDYSPALIRPLQIKGLLEQYNQNLDEAENTNRRAQHLIHRHDGVYSLEQQPILDQLTLLHIQKGRISDASREQFYAYRINSVEYGEDNTDILPAMHRYASFLKDIGNFKESVEYYYSAISLIEAEYGKDDIRLIEPLQGIADVRLRQKEIVRYGYASPSRVNTNYPGLRLTDAFGGRYYLSNLEPTQIRGGEDALERVVGIVTEDPGSDIGDQITALVQLGDMYVVTSDPRARQVYIQAWEMMQQREDLAELSNELFGLPTRIHPGSIVNLPLLKEAREEPYYARAELTVKPNGRTGNVEIIESNIPNEERRILKRRLFMYRYRPRIVDGEFVATNNLSIMQSYRAVGKPRSKTVAPEEQEVQDEGSTPEGNKL